MEDPAMKRRALLLALLFFLIISPCCAGQVTLLAGQKEYYFLTGEDAALPLILNNTYDHDITGVLRFSSAAESPGGNATKTVQEKTFTLFTGQRSYLLPVGRSATPRVLHCDIVFVYLENGGRRASLEDILVHYVKTPSEIRVNQNPQESTDSPDPAAGLTGSSVSGSPTPSADPREKVQNSQVPQDVKSLQQQLQKEDADSGRQKKEFLSLLMLDPTISAIDRSLVDEGFALTGPEVYPTTTNRSGNFSFSYAMKSQSAVVRGSVDDGSFLFADESSGSTIPLPALLRENETFRTWESDLAASGFSPNATMVQYTPGRIAVNLTYADAKNRFLHLKAAIVNGTLTALERDTVEEPSPHVVAVLSVLLICLLSGGILFLGRRLPRSPPREVETSAPDPVQPGYRQIAEKMVDEAGELARQGRYPDAYARAGQALRLVLSHTMSDGQELTTGEAFRLLSLHGAGDARIAEMLGRCSMVAFAKDTPDPEEFQGILKGIRDLLVPED
jgi:hypothetical protein